MWCRLQVESDAGQGQRGTEHQSGEWKSHEGHVDSEEEKEPTAGLKGGRALHPRRPGVLLPWPGVRLTVTEIISATEHLRTSSAKPSELQRRASDSRCNPIGHIHLLAR